MTGQILEFLPERFGVTESRSIFLSALSVRKVQYRLSLREISVS
jgi:hypothetical protein